MPAENTASKKEKIDFNYHVKPILSDKCFACHGPDVKKRQADLRLDTEEGAFKALKSDSNHFAIVKGNAEESFLVKTNIFRRSFIPHAASRIQPGTNGRGKKYS